MAEFMPENDVTNAKEDPRTEIDDGDVFMTPPSGDRRRKKKKKSGGFGFFRAALHILRKKPDDDEKAAMNKQKSNESDGNWKKIVGSMRPLHVQETPQSPAYLMTPGTDYSPASPAASSSCGTLSQYASAQNLHDLDIDDDEADPDEVFDAISGDEMIDAKAEEFIAQFYRQMQLQNSDRYNHDYRGF